jgi:hypothetical protein
MGASKDDNTRKLQPPLNPLLPQHGCIAAGISPKGFRADLWVEVNSGGKMHGVAIPTKPRTLGIVYIVRRRAELLPIIVCALERNTATALATEANTNISTVPFQAV